MIRTFYIIYQVCFALPLVFALTAITSIVTIIGCTFGFAKFAAYWPSRVWSWLVIKLFLLPVHKEVSENINPNTSYVFVANHQGFFDIFLFYAYLGHDLRWMMKKSLRKMFLVGKACESAGHIFVDKSGPKAIMHTYEEARHKLQDGASLVVFPEGARTRDGRICQFKKGAFQLADELQLPVIPITIDGSFDVLPRTSRFLIVHWSPLRFIIHKPIMPNGQGADNISHTMQKSYEAIISDLPEERRREKC